MVSEGCEQNYVPKEVQFDKALSFHPLDRDREVPQPEGRVEIGRNRFYFVADSPIEAV